MDVASASEWQSGLERMDVVERDQEGRAVVCETLSDVKLRKVRSRVRFSYDEPTRLSWQQIEEGDLQSKPLEECRHVLYGQLVREHDGILVGIERLLRPLYLPLFLRMKRDLPYP